MLKLTEFQLTSGPKVSVAGGDMPEYTYQVLTDPDRTALASEWHQEAAQTYWERMKQDGVSYRVHQYANGNGPIWMEIEAKKKAEK